MEDFELDDNGKSYIMIDDSMRLAISSRNWQLQKKQIALTGKEAGKVSWIAFRYYTSLQSALNDIVHIKTAQENFKTVQGLIEANTKVINELVEAFSPEYKITNLD